MLIDLERAYDRMGWEEMKTMLRIWFGSKGTGNRKGCF